MVFLRGSQNVRKPTLEESACCMVTCQIPGPKKTICQFQPPPTNTVTNQHGGPCAFSIKALRPEKALPRQSWHGLSFDIDGFPGQGSDCFRLSKTRREAGKALHHEMYHQPSKRNHHAQLQHTSLLLISTGPLSNTGIGNHDVRLCE